MASQIIEKDIYNGLFHIIHNPNAKGRAPRYVVNGMKPKGVTTIMGQTLAKDLMSWAVDCSTQYLREKLPVITEADLVEAALEHTRRRDTGAGFGTEAHALVEGFLIHQDIASHGASPEAMNAFNAFVAWFEEVKPEVINVEEVVYSTDYAYAGTYDCLLRVGKKTYLCDLKTTNPSKKAPQGVYAENFIQLGAYAGAHEEQRQYEIAHGGSELVKIDDLMVISAKKNGVLDVVTATDVGMPVEVCSEMFRKVANLYEFLAYTTKQLGGKA